MEHRLREAVDVPVFHDDEHGTAVVVLSALAIALRVTGKTLDDVRIVLSGAGAAGTAIVRLLQAAASPQIAVYDSHGVLHPGREDISGEKRWLAEHTQPSSHGTELGKALDGADVFIGVSAAGLLQEQDVARMADGAIGLRASPAAEGQVVMIRVGTSGWSYDHWHPELYPPGIAAGDRLARYAAAFCTAELNSSFYRWPRPSAFSNWRQRLPDGFRLSVKAPRGLTHARRLYAPETWLERIAAGWHELGGTRAVLLVQLAPSHARDDARLAYFLELVPDWMRVAVEFRHASWHCEDVFALLAAHRAGYCVMSGAGLPCILRATTDFAYVRMHGPDHHHLYAGSYPDADLSWWASRIGEWDTVGHDVFVYFNNDGDANAVRNARTLRALLGQ